MNREAIDSVIRSLRRVNIEKTFFGQTVAIRFGLVDSDVEALEVLLDTGAATAGRLSDVMGLTTGAVTRVIDRLEQAGYVRRSPDPADRRRVIVEVVPEKVAGVQAVLGRVGEAGAADIGRYSEAELAVINDFLTRMAEVTREEATALRGTDAPDSDPPMEHTAPLGGLTSAKLLFRSGANELTVRGAVVDELYQARFEGPAPQVRLRDGVVSVQYKGAFRPWDWRKRNADIGLNRSIPWELEVVGGANKMTGDLASVDLRSFNLTGGVDNLRLNLGRPTGIVRVHLVGGANKVRVERPAGVPARLRVAGGAGGIELDRQRLGGTAGQTVLESAGIEGAEDRYEIEVTGGLGRIQVTEAAGG